MKVIHAFNMANDNYFVVKGLRKLGVDAELLIQKPSHVASLPQWEEANVDMKTLGDVYAPNWCAFKDWNLPDWVHVWDASKSWYPLSRTFRWIQVIRTLSKYDLVVGQTPFAKVAPFYKTVTGKPYAIYDSGLIRYLIHQNKGLKRAHKGYSEAQLIFFTNTDTEEMLRKYNANLVYTPFAIDTELYAPSNQESNNTVFLHPTRHIWNEKGNDKLIRAFARYIKRNPKASLIMVDWHQSNVDNIQDSKKLIGNLGITENISWLPLMSKRQLREAYHYASAIFDQFIFGALGTTGPEALSCGKPVVAHVKPELWMRYHKSSPPVINAFTEEEIYQAMCLLEDSDKRTKVGRLGREWILENCEMCNVAKLQLAAYKKAIQN